MYAIVDIAGQQFKVKKDEKILVPKLSSEIGASVDFDRVLLVSNEGEVTIGQPTIEGATVSAKVVGNTRGKKVIIFKKKRRKGYQVTRGHKQDYTSILIQSITSK